MQKMTPYQTSNKFQLPEYLFHNTNGQFIQHLFDSLSSAVLYLDQWGRICAANLKAKELFHRNDLMGKTVLEFLLDWDDPINYQREVLMVARTGMSLIGTVERAIIHGKEHWFQTDKVAIHDDVGDITGVLIILDDITRLKDHEIRLQKSEAKYRAFIENSQDAIWHFDIYPPIPIDWPQQHIVDKIIDRAKLGDCNSVFAKGYYSTPKRLKGLMLEKAGSRTRVMDVDTFVENQFHLSAQEMIWNSASGDNTCLQISANGTIEKGQLVGIWGVTRDTTERRRHMDELEYQATHDMLTGLPNRTKLQSLVNTAMADESRQGSLVLMIIDLDGFKEINDTLGHHMGDHILKNIGPRI